MTEPSRPPRHTATSTFGVGRREGHDASAFYQRFTPPQLSDDETINRPPELLAELGPGRTYLGSIDELDVLPDNSVALVVTSPPYFVGKEYELAVTGDDPGDESGDDGATHRVPTTYFEYLDMLRSVFATCSRVLEPGGRIAVNVANLGRKPYRSLSADVISILQDDLGLLLRGEVIWEKAQVSSGSCAWGSFAKASNPVLRDMTERVIIASKGRFSRALPLSKRRDRGLPHRSTLTNDEFVDVTRDVWRIDAESATRIGHPAPFPVELPRRLIDLYTYEGDLVVDPFAGSGTTLVAAARAGRIGVGFDTDPDYVELSEHRLTTELDRLAELDSSVDLTEATTEARQERYQAQAVDEGKKMHDIATRRLTEAGFASVESGRSVSGVADVAFRVGHDQGDHHTLVDVVGGFTTNKPGLQRVDAVWRLLGRLHALRAMPPSVDGGPGPVIVLTSTLPRPGSPADKALRAVGPQVILDAIELYDPAGLARLANYARSARPVPGIGFWTADELAAVAG